MPKQTQGSNSGFPQQPRHSRQGQTRQRASETAQDFSREIGRMPDHIRRMYDEEDLRQQDQRLGIKREDKPLRSFEILGW